MIINYFEVDDIMHRFNVIFYLVCLFGFTSVCGFNFMPTTKTALDEKSKADK